jgi:6-phosphogluconolactonase/glucosamine-6-phosphate isomerase/deaminase
MVFVKQALLDEEQRRGKGGSDPRTTESRGDDTALNAGRRYSSKGRKPGKCYACGKSGHFAQDCPNTKNHQSTSQRSKPPPRHRAKKAAEILGEADSESGQTFVATIGLKTVEERSEDWIIDSGASRHMTFQKELLYDYREFETPELVGLGDGHSIQALGSGHVKIVTEL